jgi:hypothetical protein
MLWSSHIRHRLWEAVKLSQICLVVFFWHQGTFVASAMTWLAKCNMMMMMMMII